MRDFKVDNYKAQTPINFGKTDPGVPGQEPKKEPEEKAEYVQNAPETLGRSLVNKTDNLKNDVAFGIAHPDAIKKADMFFNNAFDTLQAQGDPQAYAKASAMTKIYVDEFCS